jgi:uncharacterized protein
VSALHAAKDDFQTSATQRKVASFRYSRPRKGPWLQLLEITDWEWNSLELVIPDLPAALEGVRIVHIGDLHLRPRWPKALENVIERLNADVPDVLICTGDFVDNRSDHRPALPVLRKFLSSVHSKFGTFGTTGNHDGDLVRPHLSALGVHVVLHERVEALVHGEPIELIGFPGMERSDLNETFVRSLPPKRAGVPRIIVSHYPDLIRAAVAANLNPDLFLAGHTHGGQVCLPNEAPIIRHDSLPVRFCKGAHDYQGTCLIVTRGMGFTTLPIRVFCPAEVIEIILKRQ